MAVWNKEHGPILDKNKNHDTPPHWAISLTILSLHIFNFLSHISSLSDSDN